MAALPELSLEQQAAVRNMRRIYSRATRVSTDLASRMAKASASGVAAWAQAKKAKNFGQFAEHLQANLDLALDRATAIDPNRHPYDVLLEDYDPGTTVEDLRGMFGTLQQGLTHVRQQALASQRAEAFEETFDILQQLALHQDVV